MCFSGSIRVRRKTKMPSLKCIGGANDGSFVQMIGDHQDVQLIDPVGTIGFDRMNPLSPTSEYRHYAATIYTRRKISFGNPIDFIEYLAPLDWTDMQAISFLFSKHDPRHT